MRKLLLLMMVVSISTAQLFAQGRTVSGKVIDEKGGAPLNGVSVVVKGTSVGTSTGKDGSFSLNLPANAKTLVFSFIDYTSLEVNIGNQSTFNVSLTSEERTIQEVVVVGYGTQKKKTVTSSIGKIDPAPIADLVTPSIDRQLAGRTAGIQVTTSSGLVNVAPRIRIRGVNSINGSRSPLIVVDGTPVLDGGFSGVANTNTLADINPADVESVEVLKDGAAAAIYGSRAANGVLLITTRKGRAGRSNVNYSATFGFSNPYNTFDLLNAQEFVSIANEKYTNYKLDYTYNNPADPNRFYYRSDHYNFAKNKVPVIFYFTGVHEDYHRPGDDVEKIMFDKQSKIVQLVFHTAWELSNRDERIKVDSNKP